MRVKYISISLTSLHLFCALLPLRETRPVLRRPTQGSFSNLDVFIRLQFVYKVKIAMSYILPEMSIKPFKELVERHKIFYNIYIWI